MEVKKHITDWKNRDSKKYAKYKKSYNEKNKTYCIPDSQLFNGCTEEQIRRLKQFEMKSKKYLGLE